MHLRIVRTSPETLDMPQIIKPTVPSNGRVVISLCDYSGNWPRPFADYGYTVLHYDLKHGDDVLTLTPDAITAHVDAAMIDRADGDIAGVLMAPPCTDFSVSGAQYWPKKDADGTTAKALAIVDACVAIGKHFALTDGAWWALENPVGRLSKLRPDLGKPLCYFHPYEYAHMAPEGLFERNRYTKKTGLWGDFPSDLFRKFAMENGGPVRVCSQGSWLQKLGGKSERTKELRSMTPEGFSEAFAWAMVVHMHDSDGNPRSAVECALQRQGVLLAN